MADDLEPALVPELLVADIDRSIGFWCEVCGFTVSYSRREERFSYITLGSAHLMLEQVGIGRNWVTGPLERPLGRGINLQITAPESDATVCALESSGIDIFMPPEIKWYRIEDYEAGVQQFLVQDPDGYLVRFQSPVGRSPRAR